MEEKEEAEETLRKHQKSIKESKSQREMDHFDIFSKDSGNDLHMSKHMS